MIHLKRHMVYVFGPYSADTPEQIQANIDKAQAAGIKLARLGFAPLIPHLNTAHWDIHAPEITHDGYMEIDLAWAIYADYAYGLDGWWNSKGSIIEVNFFIENLTPIFLESPASYEKMREMFLYRQQAMKVQ